MEAFLNYYDNSYLQYIAKLVAFSSFNKIIAGLTLPIEVLLKDQSQDYFINSGRTFYST